MGDSRLPRLTTLLVAGGSVVFTAWSLGGAITQGWHTRQAGVTALVLLVLARLTFPLRRRVM